MAKKKSGTKSRKRPRQTTRSNSPKRRKKSLKAKVSPYVFPTSLAAAFLVPYYNRSKSSGTGMIELMKQDVQNFNKDDAINRVKDNAAVIGVLVGGGAAIKKIKPIPKGMSNIVGDAMVGAGLGTLAKVVIDPPTVNPVANKRIVHTTWCPEPPPVTSMVYDRPLYDDYARA